MGTEADYRLVNDIIDHHGERIQNLKKYYPFFYLQATSLAQYHEGKYASLDMGYISLALLRFFIEENNFNEREVTLKEIYDFMGSLLQRDFGLHLPQEEERELEAYLFGKLCNDGKPFQFEYFDPADKKHKTARMKLIEGRIFDGDVVYSITADAIEFYLDTKEIREESKINIEQLLLEKMIRTKNFSGGIEVVRRMNSEVNRLRRRKKEVLMIFGCNIFEGVAALEEFNRTGMRWFAQEQKAFTHNKQLVDAARQRAESAQAMDACALKEIFLLDLELQRAMANHGKLLADCMELQVRADEVIHKYKFSRLKNAFDFRGFLERAKEQDDAVCLGEVILPLLKPHIKKRFSLSQVENMLLATAPGEEKPQMLPGGEEEDYRFDDEVEEERIDGNYQAVLKTLLDTLLVKKQFDLAEFNKVLENKYFDEIFKNSDYYSFLVQLCQKRVYDLAEIRKKQDTFLDGILAGMLKELPEERYRGLRFQIKLLSDLSDGSGQAEELGHEGGGGGNVFFTSNIRFFRL